MWELGEESLIFCYWFCWGIELLEIPCFKVIFFIRQAAAFIQKLIAEMCLAGIINAAIVP